MSKRDSGLEYTLCGLAVKCPDAFVPLFYHGFTPRHCLGFERAAASDACKGDWWLVSQEHLRSYRHGQLATSKGGIAIRIKGMLRHFEMQP